MKKFLVMTVILTVCMSIPSFSLISNTDAVSNQNLINLATQPKDSTTVTLSTYVSPAILYKDQAKQPIVFALVDQDGNYVSSASFDVKYTDGTTASYTVAEISKGFYRFIVDTAGVTQHDIKFTAAVDTNSGSINSNSVIIFLMDKDAFNPYVDVNTIYSISPYGKGPTDCGNGIARRVFDKLPCTIGNAFEVSVGYWQVTDPANWHVYNVKTAIKGPVEKIGKNRYICNKAGTITASIGTIVWERENTNCPLWNTQISEGEMSLNAEAHSYSKTFDICKNEDMPFLSKTYLEDGGQTDETTIEAGKSADLVLDLNEEKKPYDMLFTNKIVHIYMTDGHSILPYAFTTNAKKVSEIWYNPSEAPKTGIPEMPIIFNNTTSSLEVRDVVDTSTFSNIQFNYPNCPDSGYHLVVQVFAEQIYFDSNGDIHATFPLINETLDNIQITPVVKVLNSTATILEGTIDSETILAGVNSTIDISNPHFTLGKPKWILTFNGKPVEGSVKETSTGYRAILKHSLNDTGKLEIFGYSYDTTSHYSKKEQTTIEIPVVKPEFTLRLELSDGTKIDNDGILTEGFFERIYGTVADPRGIHDFTSDWWTFKPEASHTSFGIPLSKVYYNTPGGANDRFPTVIGYTNPNLEEDPTFDLYFVASDNTEIYITTFKLVSPTITVDPKEIQPQPAATATHVTFTVTDAHGHSAPGIEVAVLDPNYNKITSGMKTGPKGELDWAFSPAELGLYIVYISPVFSDRKDQPPCGWPENSATVTIKVVCQAPVVDTEKPVIAITSPEDGATVGTNTVTVKGIVTDNVGVEELYIGSMKIDFASDGSFSTSVNLTEGTNTITITATDKAGNKATNTITVIYKKPVPVRKTVIKVQIGSFTMTVNGTFEDLDVAPVIHEGHTYLPLRAIAEALGAEVDWIAATKSITLTLGESSVGLQIGNNFAVVNGNNVKIYPPYLQPYGDGTYAATMVPLRVIAEGLGAEVGWNPDTRVVTISLIQP